MLLSFRRAHFIVALAITSLGAAAQAQEALRVAASPVPHAEILEFVRPQLKAQGVDLQVKVFNDYVQPNLAVSDKQLDANFFQNRPYLESFTKDRKSDIVEVPNSDVHIEPFGAYSQKIRKTSELREGAVVAIPSDPSNSGRALALLAKQGLIKLKDPSNIKSTARDIVANPKKLVIRELESAQLPRAARCRSRADQHQLCARGQARSGQGCALHRGRPQVALCQFHCVAQRQREFAGHRQAGGCAPYGRGPQVHPGQVQGRRDSGLLSEKT